MRVTLALLTVLLAAPLGADERATETAVRDAIVAAVRARMGASAEVSFERLLVDEGWEGASPVARPDPGARLGGPTRFALGDPPATPGAAVRWTGRAEADLRVEVEHLHARRAIARGETLTADAVELVRHAIDGPLRAWPGAEAVGRSRVLGDIAPGTCLSPRRLMAVALVRAGQDVQALVRIDGVEAEARLVAGDSGDAGDVIRVVNPSSRRTRNARVVGPGKVEVLHE